jgi:hypothetical protein
MGAIQEVEVRGENNAVYAFQDAKLMFHQLTVTTHLLG